MPNHAVGVSPTFGKIVTALSGKELRRKERFREPSRILIEIQGMIGTLLENQSTMSLRSHPSL
jgi:hypothetical protein